MVLLDACLLDGLLKVGIVTEIHHLVTKGCGCPTIGIGIEHVQVAVSVGNAEDTAIIDMRLASRTALGDDVDDTRGTPRAILSRLRSILKDSETLDVGGIERSQHRKVARHTVHHDEGFVAAGERSGTTQADGFKSGSTVAVLLNRETRHTSLDSLQRVGKQFLVHLLFGDKLHGARQVVQRSAGVTHMKKCIGTRVFRERHLRTKPHR